MHIGLITDFLCREKIYNVSDMCQIGRYDFPDIFAYVFQAQWSFFFSPTICDGLILTSVDGPIKTYKLASIRFFSPLRISSLSAKSTLKLF